MWSKLTCVYLFLFAFICAEQQNATAPNWLIKNSYSNQLLTAMDRCKNRSKVSRSPLSKIITFGSRLKSMCKISLSVWRFYICFMLLGCCILSKRGCLFHESDTRKCRILPLRCFVLIPINCHLTAIYIYSRIWVSPNF